MLTAPSVILSLDASANFTRMHELSAHLFNVPLSRSSVTVRRFEEIINGREYLIEVAEVGVDRWRAQIARVPGGSAALMPFYGSTPDEAARQLSEWLIRAHRTATNSV